MKIDLTKKQVEFIQDVISFDYVAARVDNESGSGAIVTMYWLRKLLSTGDMLERKTGVKSKVREQMEGWG